jgi:hypothetical protein
MTFVFFDVITFSQTQGYWSCVLHTLWITLISKIFRYLEQLQWCLVCDPVKLFLTSKFSYLVFKKISNPTHKTKIGTKCRDHSRRSIGWMKIGGGGGVI